MTDRADRLLFTTDSIATILGGDRDLIRSGGWEVRRKEIQKKTRSQNLHVVHLKSPTAKSTIRNIYLILTAFFVGSKQKVMVAKTNIHAINIWKIRIFGYSRKQKESVSFQFISAFVNAPVWYVRNPNRP